jgi:hypothetical protein
MKEPIKYGKKYMLLVLFALSILHNACIEPFEPQTVTFESALVIDATITNETKEQEIYLNRTFALEDDGPNPESNATVRVEDDAGNTYTFRENTPGSYVSDISFAAQAGRNYQLFITTNDGRSYSSESVQLPGTTQIDELYAERLVNDDGVEGMAIFVDSFDPTGTSMNYRYEYEETFRIIAPEWTPDDLIGDPEGGCGLLIVPREGEEETCYRTDISNTIILTDTNGFDEDRVSRFTVRFINRDNYIISHRYSILVRQFVQSNEAYTFFETLNDFSGSESLFSETQPGFLIGNVASDENEDEKVLGYFDLASVDEQRLFFDYQDFFPGEPLPPYIIPCRENAPPLANPGGCVLRRIVEANLVRYTGRNDPPQPGEGPFTVVPRVCGDCTEIGEVAVPEFWTEE